MKFGGAIWIFATLTIVLVATAGCTTSQPPSTATPSPVATVLGVPANPTSTPSTQAATSGLDTSISVHYNDYSCIDVTQGLGVTYLNPGEQYTIQANSPGSNTINVNVLLLNVNDYQKIIEVKPEWDPVNKVWVYAGLVPLVQFNDVTVPQEKTVTIKTQGKYYLCADDRKETGAGQNLYQVPVKMIRS
jgi:hypothetical protein